MATRRGAFSAPRDRRWIRQPARQWLRPTAFFYILLTSIYSCAAVGRRLTMTFSRRLCVRASPWWLTVRFAALQLVSMWWLGQPDDLGA